MLYFGFASTMNTVRIIINATYYVPKHMSAKTFSTADENNIKTQNGQTKQIMTNDDR